MSSPFLFRVGYVLSYVCHSGSLPNDGVTGSVLQVPVPEAVRDDVTDDV